MNEETLLGVPVKLAQKGFQGTVDGVAVVGGAATDLAKKGGDLTKAGVDGTLDAAKQVTHQTADLGRDFLLDKAETDLDKVYDLQLRRTPWDASPPRRVSCHPADFGAQVGRCLSDFIPGFAAVASVGSHATIEQATAQRFVDTVAHPEVEDLANQLKSLILLKRLRRQAAQLTPLARDLTPFVGRWGIVSEVGRREYLNACDLNFVVRRVALSMPTPPMLFFVDEQSTLHSQQGPVLGRMVVSLHPQRETTISETFQGVVSEITSRWEDGPDGRPILSCRTCTIGKEDVCEQRSRVEADSATGMPQRLVVETRLRIKPGAPTIAYDRVYEPLPAEVDSTSSSR